MVRLQALHVSAEGVFLGPALHLPWAKQAMSAPLRLQVQLRSGP